MCIKINEVKRNPFESNVYFTTILHFRYNLVSLSINK